MSCWSHFWRKQAHSLEHIGNTTVYISDDWCSLLNSIIAIFQEKSMFKIAKKRKFQPQITNNYPSKCLKSPLNWTKFRSMPLDPGPLGRAAFGGYFSEPPPTNSWIRPRTLFMFVYMNIRKSWAGMLEKQNDIKMLSNKAGKKRLKPAVNTTM